MDALAEMNYTAEARGSQFERCHCVSRGAQSSRFMLAMPKPLATVDEEDVAGHVVGSHEIEHGFGHVFRRAPAFEQGHAGDTGDAFG